MDITFEIERIEDGLAYGPLEWKAESLKTGAFSGPYGRKELPQGLFHVFRNSLLDKPGQPAYCDSLRQCWFQKIEPQFSTPRTDLGIHPDGNLVGTLGCIGILEANTKPWYDAFYKASKNGFLTLVVK